MENPQDEEGTRMEKIKELILTEREFINLPYAHDESNRPYVFELEGRGKKLVYIGANHTNVPEDPLFTEVEARFKDVNPEIVYVEGMEVINRSPDEIRKKAAKLNKQEAKSKSEGAFTLKLAVDSGIDFESPEPQFADEIQYLLSKGFSKKDIFIYQIYKIINQYQREQKGGTIAGCKEYLKPFFYSFRVASRWSEEELEKLERELLEELDTENNNTYRDQVDPMPWEGSSQTVINEISRNSSRFRDRHIVGRIAEGLKKYNRLFVVYGFAHSVMQEPAIRALMDPSSSPLKVRGD